jgi:chemotaxis protein MotB
VKKFKIKSSEQAVEEEAKWLTTFNDLTTLLMVFFVLLFSMSSLDVKKLKFFQVSLQSGLGILEKGENVEVGITEKIPIPETFDKDEITLGEEMELEEEAPPENEVSLEDEVVLEEEAAGEGKGRISSETWEVFPIPEVTKEEEMKASIDALDSELDVGVTYTKEGVVLTLENTILFASAVSEINPGAFPVLDKIAAIIKNTSKPIRVEGHTDDDPIHTEMFPSNWELSTARAVNVVKYFVESGKIPPQRLSAVGYGEAKPVFPNDTPENKAGNRRVEIVLMMEEER